MQAKGQKLIHLYFHAPCFDGAASAAIASAYLEQVQGFSRQELHGVNYDLKHGWMTSELLRPCAIVDFLYHPAASFWADHHPTAFLNAELRRDFEGRRGPDLFYDNAATSCAVLLWQHWGGALSDLAAHFEPLVYWADRIDSARYDTVDEAVSLRAPALQISVALGTIRDETFSRDLVRLFRTRSLEEIASLPHVRKEFEKGWNLQQQGLARLKQSVHLIENGIVAFDVDGRDVLVNRYAQFSLFPNARYSIGIVRSDDKAKITVMRNPWMDFPSAPLGQLCVKFGGGGHQRVGSIVVRDHDPQQAFAGLLNALVAWEGASLVGA